MRWIFIYSAILLMTATATVHAQNAWELANSYASQALVDSPDLQAAEQGVRYAKYKKRESFGNMLPAISASSRYSKADGGREIQFDINDFLPDDIVPRDLPPTVIPFIRETEQVTKIEARQPLFNAGVFYYFKVQSYQEDAERSGYQAKQTTLFADVRKAYFRAAQARELVAVAEAELEAAERQLKDVQSLRATGAAPESDVKRATAAKASSSARLTAARAQATLAVQNFNRLRGAELSAGVIWPDSVAFQDLAPPEMEVAVERALAQRHELRQLDNAVESLNAAEKTALSQYLPTLSAAAEYGYQGEKYDFDNQSDYYIVSGVFSWDLFSGFKREAQRQQAVSERRQLEFTREAVRDRIRQDVTAALLEYDSNREQLTAAREARTAADEALRMVEAMYREGLATQTDVTDARAQRTEAAAGEIAARYGVLIAKADLWRSMGWMVDTGENQ